MNVRGKERGGWGVSMGRTGDLMVYKYQYIYS